MGILSRFVNNQQQTPALRTHPSNPASWLLSAFSGGAKTTTGITVTEESSLTGSAVWSAVTQLAQTPASLDLNYYKRILPRGKEERPNDPYFRLLHLQPNPEQTAMVYREQQMGQTLLYGTGYSEIERGSRNEIVGLWPLQSSRMEIGRTPDGEIGYIYHLPNGAPKTFRSNLILRITGFSLTGIAGVKVIQTHANTIGIAQALDQWAGLFFSNNATPPAVLEHPGRLSEKAHDNLQVSWNDSHQGLENSNRIAILEEGMKLNQYGVSPEQAQAIESRQFSIGEDARIFNMPMHMLKDLENATYSNIEQQSLEFVINTLRPWLVRLEQAYITQLLTVKEQKKYFWKHNVDSLLRGDTESRHKSYTSGRQWGYMSANDVREFEDWNNIGKKGDIYLQPMNMVEAGTVPVEYDPTSNPQTPHPDPQPPGAPIAEEENSNDPIKRRKSEYRDSDDTPIGRDRIQATFSRLFLDGATRVVNREITAVNRALEKYVKTRDQIDFEVWLQRFYKDLPAHIQKTLGPIFRSYGEEIMVQASGEIDFEPDLTPELKRFLTDYITNYANRHTQSSMGQLISLLHDPDTEDPTQVPTLIEDRVNQWGEKRPEKIQVNEITRLGSAVAAFTFFGAGLSTIWRIRGPETCDYCKTLNGKVVRLGGVLLKPGSEVYVPQKDPMLVRGLVNHPPLHSHCDCFISSW